MLHFQVIEKAFSGSRDKKRTDLTKDYKDRYGIKKNKRAIFDVFESQLSICRSGL